MRDIIGRIVWNPWVYRVTCGVLFVLVMVAVRYGLQVLRSTNDTPLIAMVGLPIIAGCLLIAWLVDRHRAHPH